MSPQITSSTGRLAILGLVGVATMRLAAGAAEPQAPMPPLPGQPQATASAQAPTESVLLLSNGQVLPPGHLSEDGDFYVLRQRAGTIRFPKRQVERVFGSIQAVYQYKRSRFPANDAAEHLKLARWCLTNKLDAEARAELQEVLEISPQSREAKAMMASLDAQAERAMRPKEDRQILQVGGGGIDPQAVQPMPAAVRGPRPRGVAEPAALPQILDLPQALSVKRAREFAQFVHPELQRHCAKCHNERSKTSFQLVEIHAPRDYQDPMVLRTNLEATLQLIDPQNLPQSPLLTSLLLPHKPTNQPILPSPKTRVYRTLWTWVNSLRVPSEQESASVPVAATGSGFGSDRPTQELPAPAPRAAGAPNTIAPGQIVPAGSLSPTAPAPPENTPLPPGQMLPGSYSGPSPYAPGPLDFPVPPVVGGGYTVPADPKNPAKPAPTDPNMSRASLPANAPAIPPSTAAPASAKSDAPDAAKKKKSRLDPEALQKFLMKRNDK